MRLTDEELIGAIDEANGGSEWRGGWEISDVLEEQDRQIAKAQLKKVVEWLQASSMDARTHIFQVSEAEYQALLKEID